MLNPKSGRSRASLPPSVTRLREGHRGSKSSSQVHLPRLYTARGGRAARWRVLSRKTTQRRTHHRRNHLRVYAEGRRTLHPAAWRQGPRHLPGRPTHCCRRHNAGTSASVATPRLHMCGTVDQEAQVSTRNAKNHGHQQDSHRHQRIHISGNCLWALRENLGHRRDLNRALPTEGGAVGWRDGTHGEGAGPGLISSNTYLIFFKA